MNDFRTIVHERFPDIPWVDPAPCEPRLCARGEHPMEGDNVRPSGACRACDDEQKVLRRLAERARKEAGAWGLS